MSNSTNEILFKKFEIISCYKKDEHSAVYLANHIYLDKKVFLKVLNTATIPDSSVNERFKREAKILAQIEHPNIIKVFDFGMYKEYFYISFEYFESQNLRELFGSKKDLTEIKKNIFIQLVKGLKFAHDKNVIHRDIKPENILINANNEVKLTDFGLAQDSFDNLVTQKYSVVGTPAYMSPEQINGEKLTIKSDLFSLGITAVELFTGKNPFLGKDANETINNIISFNGIDDDIILEKLPDEIQKVLQGLLVLNPNDRISDCGEILKILNITHEFENLSIDKNKRNIWLIPILFVVIIGSLWFIFTFIVSSNPEKISSLNLPEKIEKDISANENNLIGESGEDLKITNNPELITNNQIELDEEKSNSTIDEPLSLESPNVSNNFGQFFIKCYPWAKVYLNNEFIETTPFTKNITAKSGNYLLSLTHPDYPKYNDSIEIKSGQLSFVEINLDTLFGFFECQVYPWGEIFINGKSKGVTPLDFPIRLNEGKYELTLKNPQFHDLKSNINIQKNDTLKLKFKMRDPINN